MIQFGKRPDSILQIDVHPDDIPTIYEAITDAGLIPSRILYPLKAYIEHQYPDEVQAWKAERGRK